MPVAEYVKLSLTVLQDWRVVATAVFVLLAWTLLRYVGLVYRKPRPPMPVRRAAPKAKPVKKRPAAVSDEEAETL